MKHVKYVCQKKSMRYKDDYNLARGIGDKNSYVQQSALAVIIQQQSQNSMRNVTRVCSCEEKHNQPSRLTVAIDIHQAYECICVPCSPASQIQTSDVVAGLLRYNINLTKYLSTYQRAPSPPPTQVPSPPAQEVNMINKDPHKSIVQIYNLKPLSPYDYPIPKPNVEPQPRSQPVCVETQTSPRNQQPPGDQPINPKEKGKGKQGTPVSQNDKKIQNHMKQMAISSRYLSNTGFKKYFGRECFQNYGRENTTGVADGIVYNNYLKTFNISPHCGGNMPITQEVHKHSLVAGDNKNYQHNKIPPAHYGSPDESNKEEVLQKPISNMGKLIEESQKYHRMQKKYSCEPNVNIISHCPDILKTKKQQKAALVYPVDRPQYYPQLKSIKVSPHKKPASTVGREKPVSSMRQQAQLKRGLSPRQMAEPVQQGGLNEVSEIETNTLLQGAKNNERDEMYGRRSKQRQIIDGCYGDMHMAQMIGNKNKPQCHLCRQRRYTKCCCR